MRNGRALGGVRRAESGETLVEVLATLVVVGIAFVGIFSSIFTLVRVSSLKKDLSSKDVVLRGFAEAVKSDGGPFDGTTHLPLIPTEFWYRSCAVPGEGGANQYPAYTQSAVAGNFTPKITKVEYWDGALANQPAHFIDSSDSAGLATAGICVAGNPTDAGLQRLTLEVTSTNALGEVSAKETVVVDKRDATPKG